MPASSRSSVALAQTQAERALRACAHIVTRSKSIHRGLAPDLEYGGHLCSWSRVWIREASRGHHEPRRAAIRGAASPGSQFVGAHGNPATVVAAGAERHARMNVLVLACWRAQVRNEKSHAPTRRRRAQPPRGGLDTRQCMREFGLLQAAAPTTSWASSLSSRRRAE